jgi:hypothetical protein
LRYATLAALILLAAIGCSVVCAQIPEGILHVRLLSEF